MATRLEALDEVLVDGTAHLRGIDRLKDCGPLASASGVDESRSPHASIASSTIAATALAACDPACSNR